MYILQKIRNLCERRTKKPYVYPAQFDTEAVEIIEQVRPYTMVHPEKLFSLIEAVRYVHQSQIPGAFVECGVWRGGCVMAIALTLNKLGNSDGRFFLYDTFEGMTRPTDKDRKFSGESPLEEFEDKQTGSDRSNWCSASLDDVKRNIASIDSGQTRFTFTAGKVEDTIPGTLPQSISLLRLDTDWYESTKHEMDHLFPLLSDGGVLIIDDYGNWLGSKDAVDEYLEDHNIRMFLSKVRLSVVGVKQ